MTLASVQPGDLLLTRSRGVAPALIRFGAALRDEPNLVNHVAIAHHTDQHGTLWAIEGRPGGVGWRDASAYLKSPWTVSNAGQPKTDAQRQAVCDGAVKLLGTSYAWDAIVADAAEAFHITLPGWSPDWHGQVPGHTVCSSLAAYLYAKAGLTCPAGDRSTTPADWDKFIIENRWQ